MFLRTSDQQEDITAGWTKLESLVPLRGHKFWGAFFPDLQEYWACVEMTDGDDPKTLGLAPGVLPGGRYLRERLRGEPPAIYARIAPTVMAMAEGIATDPTRPTLEFYRARDEIDLLLPIP